MTLIHSHIKSVDHFDQFWNAKVRMLKEHFSNTPLVAFAHKFNITSFIKLYSDYLLGVSNQFNSIYIQSYSEYNSITVNQLINNYPIVSSFLLRFEPRKKTINAQKLNDFFQEYNSLSSEDKALIVVPYQIEEISDILLPDLYPSVRTSLHSFLIENSIMYSDKKNKKVFLKEFTPNNEQLMHINSSASFVLKNSFASNYMTFDSAINSITTLVNNLICDNAYLESKINEMSQQIDRQNKEGINGYLLTWH